jgi:hypothetical protein
MAILVSDPERYGQLPLVEPSGKMNRACSHVCKVPALEGG